MVYVITLLTKLSLASWLSVKTSFPANLSKRVVISAVDTDIFKTKVVKDSYGTSWLVSVAKSVALIVYQLRAVVHLFG